MSNKPNPAAYLAALLVTKAHQKDFRGNYLTQMTATDAAALASEACRLSDGFKSNAVARCNADTHDRVRRSLAREKRLERALHYINARMSAVHLHLSDRDPAAGLILESLDRETLAMERI